MKRAVGLSFGLLLAGLACLAQAQVPMTGAGKGTPGTAAAFQGAGDIVSGAQAYYGLRAYTSALRGNAVANVCNSTGGVDVGCADMLSNATTGMLVPATISGISCPGANCTLKTWYDQSGALQCSAAACDVTLTTVASRAVLTANCNGGSLPCLTFSTHAGGTYVSAASITTINQPLSFSTVTKANSNSVVLANIGNTVFVSQDTSNVYAGTSTFVTGVNGGVATNYAAQSVLNGGSSSVTVNGTTTTGSVAAGTFNNQVLIGDFSPNTAPFDGTMNEIGIWGVAFSAGNISNLTANQRGASGWNF